MHQKDVELAQLLVAREAELAERGKDLRAQLEAVEQKIAAVREAEEQREAYADILAKAANLLQRSDLTVERADTSEHEQAAAGLHQQLAELEAEELQYRELLDALREKAPQLFNAATGELKSQAVLGEELAKPAMAEPSLPEEAAEQVAVAAVESGEPSVTLTAEGQDWDESVKLFVAGSAADDQDAGAYTSISDYAYVPPEGEEEIEQESRPSAPDEPLSNEEQERFLLRFNMDSIQRQVMQVLGADASFVVDAASVMSIIPYYDPAIRGGAVKFVREELLRDFGLLSRHLNRRVMLVLDHEHEPEQQLPSQVSLHTLHGDQQGQREAQDQLLRELLGKASLNSQVCLVTGDLTLGGSLRSRRVQFLPVNDFFKM